MRILMLISAAALALVGIRSPAAGQASGAAVARYPAPGSDQQAMKWPAVNPWRVQRPGDPGSPRAFTLSTGPEFNVHSFDAAVQDIVRDTKLRFVGRPIFETLDAWTKFDGRVNRITLAPTVLNGKPGVFFMEITRPKGSSEYFAFGIEMPEPVFRAWGGAVRMMVLRGLVPSVESVPANRRAQIAAAPLARQMAFFEAAQDKQYVALSQGLLMSQAATLMRMRELNYDLLFGNDITDPTIGANRRR